MYKVTAFDFDGTLADTIPVCIRAFRDAVSPYAGHPLSSDEIVQHFGLNEKGMVKAALGEKYEAALSDFYVGYQTLLNDMPGLFPGIGGLLTELKKRNSRVCLITGKDEKSCMISLKHFGIADLFDDILCGSENTPNKAGNIKKLLEKYDVPEDDLCYIGDAASDVSACRDAGVTCCSAAWSASSSPIRLEEINPGNVFYSVEALRERLIHHNTQRNSPD